METFNCSITDSTHGIELISLVKDPANRHDFVHACNGLKVCMASNGNEFLVPVLIPEQEILRVDEKGNFYNVKFTKEAIKDIFVDFMKRKKLSNNDIDHDSNIQNKKVLFLENWIKEDETDKSNKYFDLPVGTFFTKLKVFDAEILHKIELKEINGVSIMGNFNHELIIKNNQIMEEKTLLQKLASLLKMEDAPASENDVNKRLDDLEAKLNELIASLEKSEEVAAEEVAKTEEEIKKEEEAKKAEEDKKKEEEVKMSNLTKELSEIKLLLSKLPIATEAATPMAQPSKKTMDLNEIINQNLK